MQRSQLARLTKEDLIESILATPDRNEGALKGLMGKFQDLVKEVVELKLAITSHDNNIKKKMDELHEQVNKQAATLFGRLQRKRSRKKYYTDWNKR